MSSTILERPHGARRRRRLTALAASLAIGLAGLTTAATPAYADSVVQIAGPAGVVPPDVPFEYTVTLQGADNDVGIFFTLDINGSAASIIGATGGGCTLSDTSATCQDYTSAPGSYTFTVLPTEPGVITATITASADADGTDTATTTVGSFPPAPTVVSISPSSGPVSGGTLVTITGTGLADTTAIGFPLGENLTDFSCTATTCTVVSPPGPMPGSGADVQVVTPEGTSDTGPGDVFTYTSGATIDQTIAGEGFGPVRTPAFSTDGPRLLVAFTSSDGPATRQTTTVSGAGLTWTLAQRADSKGGTAEIWTAYASGPLTDASVTSVQKSGGFAQLLTVEVFAGASGVGAGATAGKTDGRPAATVTTTAADSQVFAVGEDYSRVVAVSPGPGQSLLEQFPDNVDHNAFWVQDQNQYTPDAGTAVTVDDTLSAKDVWNLAAVEILSD